MNQEPEPLSELCRQLTFALNGIPMTDEERERNQAIADKVLAEVFGEKDSEPGE